MRQKNKHDPADYEAVCSFKADLDCLKALEKLQRKTKGRPYAIFLIREKARRFNVSSLEWEMGREHWHMIIRGECSKNELRERLVDALCRDVRRQEERLAASELVDLHFEAIRDEDVDGLFHYTAKSGESQVKSIALLPKRTRLIRNINGYFMPGERDKLWKEWIAENYQTKVERRTPVAETISVANNSIEQFIGLVEGIWANGRPLPDAR